MFSPRSVQKTQFPDVKLGVTSYCQGNRCLRYTDNSFLNQANDLALVPYLSLPRRTKPVSVPSAVNRPGGGFFWIPTVLIGAAHHSMFSTPKKTQKNTLMHRL